MAASESRALGASPTGEEGPVTKKPKVEDDDIRCGSVSYRLSEDEHKTLLNLDKTFPKWRTGPARHGQKWARIESEMRAHFPELNVGKKTLQSICARGRGKRKLYQLQRRLKELDANMDEKQDVEDVKAGTNNAEESTKGKQEVVALQAAVKKLTEQCQVQEAARKTEVGEAEHWRKQAQQVAQAKEEAEKEKELLTKDFQRLMEQHEALKERDKKKIAVLIKQLEGERGANAELLRALAEDGDEEATQGTEAEN